MINMYVLTDEGKNYLKEGLPEQQLMAVVKAKGSITFEEAGQIQNLAVALQWAKKNGWITIGHGRIELIKDAKFSKEAGEALKNIHEGKAVDKKILSVLLQRKLVEEEREDVFKKAQKEVGKEITNITPELIMTGTWKKVRIKPYNVSATGKKIYAGKRQPYSLFLSEVRQKLVELGFKEVSGCAVITEFWNFDALYQAQDHPSRDWAQTYSLRYPKHGKLPDKGIVEKVKSAHENGWKTGSTGWGYKWDSKKASRLMPVAHDTAISPITLSSKELEIPGKYFQIVRCYRPDVIDATHGVEFNQMGGFVIDEGLTFKHLLGLLKQFVCELVGPYDVKFASGYFPFTEPSCEILVKHPKLGWIESAGAGIFRAELTEPLGVTLPVIAWGFGIDRLAMIKLGISDIRQLFSSDLVWLRNRVV